MIIKLKLTNWYKRRIFPEVIVFGLFLLTFGLALAKAVQFNITTGWWSIEPYPVDKTEIAFYVFAAIAFLYVIVRNILAWRTKRK